MGSLPGFYKSRHSLRSIRTARGQKSNVLLKVLGTAQDGGIPQIGCYCKNCQKARQDPRFLRLRSSLAILDLKEKKIFIVDASPDITLQYDLIHERMERPLSDKKNVPDGIFLTHAHIGHYTGLMFYGYEALSANKLPVYCSQRMGDFLSKNGPWSQLVNGQNISLHSIELNAHIPLSSEISVTPFHVPHRDEYSDTLGFVITGQTKNLLYIPDIQSWEAWDRDINKEVERVDFALLDGTFFSPEELPGRDLSRIGHPFITASIDRLSQAAIKGRTRIYFTHLNHSNLALDPDGDASKHIHTEGFALAKEGMELFL